MSQQINDNFDLLAGLPIEKDMQKPTIAGRDAINSTKRWQGMTCFVVQTQTLYQLQGGIENTDWVGIAGTNVSNALESVIDGFYVLLAGKSTPLDWEVGDRFRGWINYRYVVGTILSLPVSLPSDIDDSSKVTLSIDSDYLNSGDVRVAVNDVSYPITGPENKIIAYTAITADRTVTLPPATASNQRIWITDESGLCSNARRIIVQPSGGDVIGGDAFSVINFPNGSGYLESNGAGKWNIISTTSVQFSSGVNTLPSYTDNGNGSVTLGTGVYSLYANTNGTGRPKAYQIAGGTFMLTDNSTNYIYAQYNTTTGAVSLQQSTTDAVINDLTTIPVFSIYRQGLTLHARDFDTQGVALANKLNRSIQQTQKVRVVEGGVLLGETTTPAVRTVTVSAGTAWVGGTEISLPAVNSASNTCYRIYPVAGVYQTTTTVTQYDNQQYSDGTNLQTLTTNNYGVRFIYRSIGNDNDMAIVVGEGNNSLGQAQVSVPPANLPAFLRHMTLVGRIIVKKGDDFATQIDQNTGGISFASAGVTDHNALNNLQTAQTGVTYGHITDGTQTIAGVKTFLNGIKIDDGTAGDQTLLTLPALTTEKYTKNVAVNYGFNIDPADPDSFFRIQEEGLHRQCFYIGDGFGEYDVFGVSLSDDSGSNWRKAFSIRGDGTVDYGQTMSLDSEKIELIAHRGFVSSFPENTNLAFSQAIGLGADALEADVQVSSDGVLYLFHDATVDALTNGTGAISSLSSTTIDALTFDALSGTIYSGTKITKLSDFLILARRKAMKVYLEIKGYRTSADIALMVTAVVNAKMERLTTFGSFTMSDLTAVRALNRNVKLILYGDSTTVPTSEIEQLGILGKSYLGWDMNALITTPSIVTTSKSRGIDVIAWTAVTTTDSDKMMDLGITKIIADNFLKLR